MNSRYEGIKNIIPHNNQLMNNTGFQQDSMAASILCSLTYAEVDQKTAEDMVKERQEAIHATVIKQRPWLPPVPCVTYFMGECSNPIWKQLEVSDVKNNQSRLALKKDNVIKEFLPMLETIEEHIEEGIQVIAYDSYGNVYEDMKFKLWGEKMYVFTRQWREFSEDYKLISGNDSIRVWLFRNKHTQRLCAMIIPILDLSVSIPARIKIRQALNAKNK